MFDCIKIKFVLDTLFHCEILEETLDFLAMHWYLLYWFSPTVAFMNSTTLTANEDNLFFFWKRKFQWIYVVVITITAVAVFSVAFATANYAQCPSIKIWYECMRACVPFDILLLLLYNTLDEIHVVRFRLYANEHAQTSASMHTYLMVSHLQINVIWM